MANLRQLSAIIIEMDMFKTIKDYIESLSKEELEELMLILISYAEYRLNYIDSSTGKQAKDFAYDIITKALDNTHPNHRKWNKVKTPDPKDFLLSWLMSDISNHFSLKSTSSTNNPELDSAEYFEQIIGDTTLGINLDSKDLRDTVFDFISEEDQKLAELFIYDEAGFKMEEIISDLGYSDRDKVYNARKRLRRAIEKALDSLK
jgi:hypothetical protein